MSRWEPDARGRLEQAAMELFTEQGFAETTVPQITARAGLTTRTFFRHFADKREVLFAYQEELPGIVARVMAGVTATHTPLQVIQEGLELVAQPFHGRLEFLRRRQLIVSSDAGLQERELRKQSILSEAITSCFLDRGVPELSAILAAHLAVTVFSVSLDRWLAQDGDRPLSQFVQETFTGLLQIGMGGGGGQLS